jgi:hypothetical protein
MFETIGFICVMLFGIYLIIQAAGMAFVTLGFTGRLSGVELVIVLTVFTIGCWILYFAFSKVTISFAIGG